MDNPNGLDEDALIDSGVFYGYPNCCVVAFVRRARRPMVELLREQGERAAAITTGLAKAEPWEGTGFLPCEACKPRCRENFDRYVAEVITPARHARTPFPQEPCACH